MLDPTEGSLSQSAAEVNPMLRLDLWRYPYVQMVSDHEDRADIDHNLVRGVGEV